jgi:kynureninase
MTLVDPLEPFTTTEAHARALDASDPLAGLRARFFSPAGKIYVDGNSLGLLSKDSLEGLTRVVEEWRTRAIGGWFEGEKPWLRVAERLGGEMAPFVGAEADEVVATGTTSVNLHTLVSTFYQPRPPRTKILADELNFPADIYALSSQVRVRGLDPARHLVLVPSADGRVLDESKIVERMTDEVAVAVLPSVLYRSGQLLDMALLTREAHSRGILIGFDCSHSAGVIPHRFDEWGVDFAFWCSYKYLNGGPGATAFLYVNRRHFEREPGLAGWFGFKKERQFEMLLDFEHEPSAGGWQISSPAILSAAPIEGALQILREAGIDAVREKSLRMTSYLIHLVDALASEEPYAFRVGTPREGERRGGHVAVEHPSSAAGVFAALTRRGVIGDLRPPNVIRICPSPLYNTYHEIWRVVAHLRATVDGGEHRT